MQDELEDDDDDDDDGGDEAADSGRQVVPLSARPILRGKRGLNFERFVEREL